MTAQTFGRYVKGFDFAIMDIVRPDGTLPPIDFAALHAAGYRVVGIRCAVCYYDGSHKAWRLAPDPCFRFYAAAARAAGLVVIPYYFPSFAVGAPAAMDQVANAKAAVDGVFIPGVDLPMCVDVEFPGANGIAGTGRPPSAVFDYVVEHLTIVTDTWGAASAYSSYNEWYELRFPTHPLLADVLFWCKTAYRLSAGQPVDTVTPPDAHRGDVSWDPRGYHQVPDPFDGTWLEQIQGDARDIGGGVHQADVNRFRLAQLGDTGFHVRGLQRRLGLPLTSVFDQTTDQVVRAMQSSHGLVVDGVVGPKSIAAAWGPTRPA